MLILALDLGRRMGVAEGDSGDPRPRVEAVTLRGTSIEKRVRCLADWLDKRLSGRPDLIVTESPMNPAASKSDRATVDLTGYYFCLQTIAALVDIPVETVPVMAVRKHFCGIACAPRVKGRKRTVKEAADARKYINEAVLARAILLGYLPKDCKDWDQANACALYEFACTATSRCRSSPNA